MMKNLSNRKAVPVPNWLDRENPNLAEVCHIINDELENDPNMSLADFAKKLNAMMVGAAYQRLQAVVRKQIGESKP